MNRVQEHYALLQELNYIPPALEGAFERAQSRLKRRNAIRNRFIVPIGAITSIFIIFVAMVNISPTVASAMERIPGLRQLAAAVSFSPTLQMAVEHDYVQRMGLTQTINDITMSIEHVMVDQRQLHIFYTLDSPIYFNMHFSVTLQGAQWDFMTSPNEVNENGEIRQLTIGFEDQVPDVVFLEIGVMDNEYIGIQETTPEALATFVFKLELDTAFTQQGEVITLDYDFVLDGQRLTLTTVEINPTHMSVNFTADDNNTAWLRELQFYFEDENGKRFYPPDGSQTKNLPAENYMMLGTHYLESAYFSGSKSLTMFIEEVEWLDKMEDVRIDLASGTTDRLPDHMHLEEIEKVDGGWMLSFSIFEHGERHLHQLIYTKTYFPNNEMEITRIDSQWTIPSTAGLRSWLFWLAETPPDEQNDEVIYLTPWHFRNVRLETPMEIRVK